MKIGDTVKSKSTNRVFSVVEQRDNHAGFLCEDSDGGRYYFFEDEVESVQDIFLDTTQPNVDDIEKALITIQNDLFSCKNAMELGQKHKNYSERLNQFLLKGIDRLCKQSDKNSVANIEND